LLTRKWRDLLLQWKAEQVDARKGIFFWPKKKKSREKGTKNWLINLCSFLLSVAKIGLPQGWVKAENLPFPIKRKLEGNKKTDIKVIINTSTLNAFENDFLLCRRFWARMSG
jgi:hypothetical protein